MERRALLLGLGALAAPSGALACAVSDPPFDPTKSRLPIIAVARADHVATLPDYAKWRVRYTFTKRVRGEVPEAKIDATVGASGMCDNDYEEPKLGSSYVLYMKRTGGKLSVGAVLSITEAKKRDPLFGGRAPT